MCLDTTEQCLPTPDMASKTQTETTPGCPWAGLLERGEGARCCSVPVAVTTRGAE